MRGCQGASERGCQGVQTRARARARGRARVILYSFLYGCRHPDTLPDTLSDTRTFGRQKWPRNRIAMARHGLMPAERTRVVDALRDWAAALEKCPSP
jgi:hypothetical protein